MADLLEITSLVSGIHTQSLTWGSHAPGLAEAWAGATHLSFSDVHLSTLTSALSDPGLVWTHIWKACSQLMAPSGAKHEGDCHSYSAQPRWRPPETARDAPRPGSSGGTVAVA